MQELVGKLISVDPEASEALKVVSYFDVLVARGAGLDGLLRAAAVLSGVVAGADRDGKISRFDAEGRRVTGDSSAQRFPVHTDARGSVWLERDGSLHANDEMIVERLALAVELIEARRNPDSRLEVVIDPTRPLAERSVALAALRLEPTSRIRIVASAPDAARSGALTTVVPTRYGVLRATLDVSGAFVPASRAGLGQWIRADRASESWEAAVIAYRLADSSFPVVDATDLGAMLILARAYDPDVPHDDVTALTRLDPRSARILRILVEADSIRSAAVQLSVHHSTLQARRESFTQELGYDPRSASGRTRYAAAEILRRLGEHE
ncbi:hypothetical protein NONO_c52810 [Nocardia nova SH22a]|uniref:PucR C-terminal helix-turn-helix domain-containing protein n=1 Tax=Nocardia nova SH22a TaxID=1415166 RepID=W5TS70_9NOCA|nr:hypothetical protein [Nocardia nova]AHH20061.1 hypothetical protein NONO_c52810 [Nocardia nova SH22a]